MVGAFVFRKMRIIQLSLLPELKWWAWGEKLGAGGWEGQSSCQGWPDCPKLASHSWSKWDLLASFWFAFRRQKGVRSRFWFVVALGVHCSLLDADGWGACGLFPNKLTDISLVAVEADSWEGLHHCMKLWAMYLSDAFHCEHFCNSFHHPSTCQYQSHTLPVSLLL